MTKLTTRRSSPKSELIDAAQRRLGSAEYRPIESLTVYARNARRHPERQLVELAASIRRFGFTMPVLVDGNGEIIAGHGRIEAARRAGLTEVPVLVARDWTHAQIRSYRLADNRLAELATWDDDLLRIELSELIEVDELLNGLGWEPTEIELMLGESAGGNDQENPARSSSKQPPAVVSRVGDSWLFGAFQLSLSRGRLKEPHEYLPADPNFFHVCVDMALRHWASTIGEEPVLGETGEKFGEVAARRAREDGVTGGAAQSEEEG